MDKLTKMLLAGAALGAFAAAPALASAGLTTGSGHSPLLVNGSIHSKTPASGSKYTNVTSTVVFTYTGHASTMYHKAVNLGHPDGWLTYTTGMPGVCQTIPGQKAHAIKDPHAKIKVDTISAHVTLTACTGTVQQYEPVYTLKTKNLTQDTFVFTIKKKRWTTSGGGKYNLTINEDWTVNID